MNATRWATVCETVRPSCAIGPLSVLCLSVCRVLSVCDVGVLWTDQDETCHAGRPRPRPHCVGWGPRSPSKRGHSLQFSAHVYCGQTAGCIRLPRSTEVGLGTGDIVLHGPSSPQKRGAQPPIFSLCLLWPNGRPSQLLLSSCNLINLSI